MRAIFSWRFSLQAQLSQIAAIAAGGAAGAVMRFWVSNGVYSLLGRGFPWGTLVVNVLGSLIMGLSYVLLLERMSVAPEWRAALMIGLLGAFTTFSTFSIETFNLLESGDWPKAVLNMVFSVLACVLAVWIGVQAGRQL
jgi:CrcB protein